MSTTDSPTYSTETSRVVSVWSAYGHRFMSDGGENTESCLTCGAMYQLLAFADDPTSGAYLAMDGSDPHQCTGDTTMVHGYDGEQPDGPNHDCNCLQCA